MPHTVLATTPGAAAKEKMLTVATVITVPGLNFQSAFDA
jgi:hypothetical protein